MKGTPINYILMLLIKLLLHTSCAHARRRSITKCAHKTREVDETTHTQKNEKKQNFMEYEKIEVLVDKENMAEIQ